MLNGASLMHIAIASVCAMLSLPVMADPSLVNWNIAYDKGTAYVAGGLWTENYKDPIALDIENGKSLHADTPVGTLTKYYVSAIKSETASMAELFYKGDGSYKRFQDGVISVPNRYDGYVKLKRVHMLYNTIWGGYQIIGVNLSGDAKKLAWREAVICGDASCYMSNNIDIANDSNRVFAIAHADLYKKMDSKSGVGSDKGAEALIKGGHRIDVMPEVANEKSGSVSPLSIYVRFGLYEESNLFTKSSGVWEKQNVPQELRSLSNFIGEIWAIPEDRVNTNDVALAEEVMKRHWTAYNSGKYIRIFTKQNNQDQEMVKGSLFITYALYQRIHKWEGIRPVGYIKDDKSVYVFFYPIIDGDYDALQIFPMSIMADSTTLSLESVKYPLYSLLSTDLIMQKLGEFYHSGKPE